MWLNSRTRILASGPDWRCIDLAFPALISARQASRGDAPVQFFARQSLRAGCFARGKQAVEVEAGIKTFTLEKVDQIFGRDIADRARREWAAAEAAERPVEAAHAFLQSGKDIGEREAESVVQVQIAQPRLADLLAHRTKRRRTCVGAA